MSIRILRVLGFDFVLGDHFILFITVIVFMVPYFGHNLFVPLFIFDGFVAFDLVALGPWHQFRY